MAKTPIQWTDFSTNPLRARNKETGKVGHFCVKCSPGCKNCYSSKQQSPYLTQLEFIAENRGKVDLFFEPKAIEQVLRHKKPTKFFWCDMTDMFGEWVPDEWIDRCFAAMALTPQHTHQVLTKRADRMLKWFAKPMGFSFTWREGYIQNAVYAINKNAHFKLTQWPLPNVWLGVSVEDQQRADERIPLLLQTPAAVRFVSYEPALGPVNFWKAIEGGSDPLFGCGDVAHLDWVIVGGESGPGARPFDIAWARSTVEQCKAAGVACFVKQLGARPVRIDEHDDVRGPTTKRLILVDKKGGDMEEWPTSLRVREFPEAA